MRPTLAPGVYGAAAYEAMIKLTAKATFSVPLLRVARLRMAHLFGALLADMRVTGTDDSEGLGASEVVATEASTVAAKSDLSENLRLPANLLTNKRRKQVPALMQPREWRQNRRALYKPIGAYINAEAGCALATMINEEWEKLDSDGNDLLKVHESGMLFVDLFRAWTTVGHYPRGRWRVLRPPRGLPTRPGAPRGVSGRVRPASGARQLRPPHD